MKRILYGIAIVACLILPIHATAETWISGYTGFLSTTDSNVSFMAPPLKGNVGGVATEWTPLVGITLGYDFNSVTQTPFRYFGVALDFSFNSYTQPQQLRGGTFIPPSVSQVVVPQITGHQFALTFFVKAQAPVFGDKFVPYMMVGPSIVWTTSDFSNLGGPTQTSTDVGVTVEAGFNWFLTPHLSIGPAFRYRHAWGPEFEFRRHINYVVAKTESDQFAAVLRLTYHF